MRSIEKITDIIVEKANHQLITWKKFWIICYRKKPHPERGTKRWMKWVNKRPQILYGVDEELTTRKICRQTNVDRGKGFVLIPTEDIFLVQCEKRTRKELNTCAKSMEKYKNILNSKDALLKDKRKASMALGEATSRLQNLVKKLPTAQKRIK